MSKQAALFDAPATPVTADTPGMSLTDPRLRRAMERGKPWELVARSWAVWLAHTTGTVCADDLRDLVAMGVLLGPPDHHNQWGGVWGQEGRYRLFRDTGRHKRSETGSRKGSAVRLWELTDYGRRMALGLERQVQREIQGA